MPRTRSPRRGSMQFWPRKRAKRPYARVRKWAERKEPRLLAFAGYKAGMTHIQIRDNSQKTTKGEIVSEAVTIIECPPIKPLAIRFYKKDGEIFKVIGQLPAKKVEKELQRKSNIPKKGLEPEEFDDLRLLVYTQPKLTGIGKKKPEIFEIALSGEKKNKIEQAKAFLEKDIKIEDVFKEGQKVDVHAITKGKGFQGTVKRFGVKIRQHKAEKTKRGVGSLGPWTPKRVAFSVPQPGKMGYHMRTEYNRWLMAITKKPQDLNQKGGITHYGLLKNSTVLLKGSVSGPKKRLVILTEPIRKETKIMQPEIVYVSKESKQ